MSTKAAMSIEGAYYYLDVSRAMFYRLLAAGAIPSFHIGRRRLVLKEHLDRFLDERLAEAEAGR